MPEEKSEDISVNGNLQITMTTSNLPEGGIHGPPQTADVNKTMTLVGPEDGPGLARSVLSKRGDLLQDAFRDAVDKNLLDAENIDKDTKSYISRLASGEITLEAMNTAAGEGTAAARGALLYALPRVVIELAQQNPDDLSKEEFYLLQNVIKKIEARRNDIYARAKAKKDAYDKKNDNLEQIFKLNFPDLISEATVENTGELLNKVAVVGAGTIAGSVAGAALGIVAATTKLVMPFAWAAFKANGVAVTGTLTTTSGAVSVAIGPIAIIAAAAVVGVTGGLVADDAEKNRAAYKNVENKAKQKIEIESFSKDGLSDSETSELFFGALELYTEIFS